MAVKLASTKIPQAVLIDGDRYSVSPVGRGHPLYWRVGDVATPRFVAGHTYRVQVLWADGNKVYRDKRIEPGDYTRNVQQWIRTPAPGLTRVHDGTIGGAAGIGISSASASKPVSFTLFSPSFDLDLVAGGALWCELELQLTSPATFGFDQRATPTCHESSMASVGAIERQAPYAATGERVHGVAVVVAPICNGTTELGALRLYLARDASNKLGYLLDYDPAKFQDGTVHQITITARLAVNYLPLLP